jgi:Ca2+-binding RTX toxin-like protein
VAGDSVIDFFRDILTKETVLSHKFIGSNGDDTATGSTKSDILLGGKGDDTLDGRFGRDRLVGGSGEDTFVFAEGYGKDVVADFDANGIDGSQDHIAATFPGAAAISRSGKNTVIDFGDGDVLTLLNVRPTQIDATDFI